MGYNINITLNKKITEEQIDEIVKALPEKFKGYFGGENQPSGWSCATDLTLRTSRKIGISGSCGMSGHIAQCFVWYLAYQLEHLDYKVRIGEWSI